MCLALFNDKSSAHFAGAYLLLCRLSNKHDILKFQLIRYDMMAAAIEHQFWAIFKVTHRLSYFFICNSQDVGLPIAAKTQPTAWHKTCFVLF